MTMNADLSRIMQADEKLHDAMDMSRRIAISAIAPAVEDGRYPAKRCEGDLLVAEADIFADGHEKLAARLILRGPDGNKQVVPMLPVVNDRWRAEAMLEARGVWHFTVQAWVDVFGGFVRDTTKKKAAGLAL